MIAEARNDAREQMRESCHPGFFKRHASTLVGVALSVLIHAIALWASIGHLSSDSQPLPLGTTKPLTISLLPAANDASSQSAQIAPPLSQEDKPVDKKTTSARKKIPRVVVATIPQTIPAIPSVAPSRDVREITPPPADDMSTMLEAARKRRADAQAQPRDGVAPQADEAQRKNQAVLANIAASLGKVNGTDQNGHGGVFQLRQVGTSHAEFLFQGWRTNLRRISTQLVAVDQNADPDIQTAVVKKMIEIIREEKHGDFIWESYRLGKQITLSARPEYDAELRQFLMQEFFSDYVPARRR